MKLLNLPSVIVNKIMMYDSHPCSDMIKKLPNKIMTESYYEIDEYVFHVKENEFSESFVENWQLWHFMNKGDIEEEKTSIKKYKLPPDSDDEDF